jgi:hypothetical protein
MSSATNVICHMPWRVAVDEIARGPSKLSVKIRSFWSSDQRRRRPPQAFQAEYCAYVVHKDCYASTGLIQQGGPHRRETRKLPASMI